MSYPFRYVGPGGLTHVTQDASSSGSARALRPCTLGQTCASPLRPANETKLHRFHQPPLSPAAWVSRCACLIRSRPRPSMLAFALASDQLAYAVAGGCRGTSTCSSDSHLSWRTLCNSRYLDHVVATCPLWPWWQHSHGSGLPCLVDHLQQLAGLLPAATAGCRKLVLPTCGLTPSAGRFPKPKDSCNQRNQAVMPGRRITSSGSGA